MIREVRDAAIVNTFAQHPEIAPEIGGALDFTHAMRETAVFLFGEHGGFIYEWCAPETYEVHVMLTKAGRGKWGIEAVHRSLEMMAQRGATHIWARISARHIGLFARQAGFHEAGTRTLYHDGQPREWRIMNWRRPCLL
jgi:hypothetical protein